MTSCTSWARALVFVAFACGLAARPAGAGFDDAAPSTPQAIIDQLREALPSTFRVYDSRRYVVFSDAGTIRAREQLERLERVFHQFDRFTTRLDLERSELTHKQVCVLFKARDDYREFARRTDDVRADWIAGYYTPKHDWIVFYDVESNPSVTAARERLDELRDQQRDLDRVYAQIRQHGSREQIRGAAESRARQQQWIEEERTRIETFASRVSVATTVHEAIHQLLFHTGVQSRTVQYPLWLSEGLATAFETEHINNAFGPDFEFEPRQTAFREALVGNLLIPLRGLVSMADVRETDGRTRAVVYDESYALMRWVCRRRSEELRDYLSICRNLPRGATPEQLIDAFEEAFGDITSLERRWLQDETALVSR